MIQLNPKNPVEYAYVKDKDGAIVEVEHVDIAALNLPEPPKNQYRIRHFAIATPDIDRLVDFYSLFLEEKEPRRFGWWFWGISGEKVDKVSGLEDTELRMAWFQIRNMELEIAEYLSHPPIEPETPRPIDAPGYNMVVFDVSDLDAARDLFVKAGGTIVSDIESMDGGQIIFGRDPDGNLLGLQKVSNEAVVSSQNFKDNGI
jgi:predicted enzyme related to lactoylglutathione lyase